MPLELTIRSRRRAVLARRWVARVAGLLLTLIALSYLVPAAVGLSIHTVTDDAMTGTMAMGSAVVTDAVPVADLQIGDVITYPVTEPSGASTLITRRIAEIDDRVLRTSGDRAGDVDPWTLVLEGSSQDMVVGSVPYAGYVVDTLDGSVRLWATAVLVVLVASAVLAGVVARRRDRLGVTTALAVPALPEDPAGEGVRVPAPRRSGDTRRGSNV